MRSIAIVAGVLVIWPCLSLAASRPAFLEYLSPRPGAMHVQPGATIIVRYADGTASGRPLPLARVQGARSGVHLGRWVVSDDGQTFIFEPHEPFQPGENVSVELGIGAAGAPSLAPGRSGVAVRSFAFDFTISGTTADIVPATADWDERYSPTPGSSLGAADESESSPSMYRGLPLPTDFPRVTVTTSTASSTGLIFTSPANRGGVAYLALYDNSGAPVFFRTLPSRANDFKKHPNGLLTYYQRGLNRHVVLDDTYEVIEEIRAGNGYTSDAHDLQILPNGHVLLMIYDRQIIDMSEIVEGGQPAATVIGLVLQELDTSRNVVFEWRSWDHIPITDAVGVDLTDNTVDYIHGNSLEMDFDGHLLLSSRHTSEVTKIDRQTGDIIWRMGFGPGNEYELVGDTQWFSYQHAARRLPNGHILVFDNGNLADPPQTRVVEYEVDEVGKVARLVWEYTYDPPIFASFTGNAQRLPNGNTLVSWGNRGITSEVTADGETVFAMVFNGEGMRTYRGFRFDWRGVAVRPELWGRTDNETLTLYFVKFGDESIDRYEVYRGGSPASLDRVASIRGNSIVIHNFEAHDPLYFQVRPAGGDAGEGLYSNVVTVDPAFSDSTTHYDAAVKITPTTLNLESRGRWIQAHIELPAECGCTVDDVDQESFVLSIIASEQTPSPVALGESGMIGGGSRSARSVVVQFPRDAVSSQLPEGEAVGLRVSGRLGDVPFEGTDYVRVIHPGGGPQTVTVDRATPHAFALHQNTPNPFNPVTTIRFDLPVPGRIGLSIYSVDGRLVRRLLRDELPAGAHVVDWDGRDERGHLVGTGIYLYRVETGSASLTRKMLFLK